MGTEKKKKNEKEKRNGYGKNEKPKREDANVLTSLFPSEKTIFFVK
jgi:hypothetical protein